MVHLLSGPYVTIGADRREVPEGSKQLLAFVALRRRRVERRQAAGTLWPFGDEERAAGNLQPGADVGQRLLDGRGRRDVLGLAVQRPLADNADPQPPVAAAALQPDPQDEDPGPARFAVLCCAAHALAHVLQQRRGAATTARAVTEADADVAATAAVRGRNARVLFGAPAGPQHYEAWEHSELGDEYGGSQRKVTLPNA